MGAELFHADKRTDRHEVVNSQFRNFAKATKLIYKLSFNIQAYSYASFSYIYECFALVENRLI